MEDILLESERFHDVRGTRQVLHAEIKAKI